MLPFRLVYSLRHGTPRTSSPTIFRPFLYIVTLHLCKFTTRQFFIMTFSTAPGEHSICSRLVVSKPFVTGCRGRHPLRVCGNCSSRRQTKIEFKLNLWVPSSSCKSNIVQPLSLLILEKISFQYKTAPIGYNISVR